MEKYKLNDRDVNRASNLILTQILFSYDIVAEDETKKRRMISDINMIIRGIKIDEQTEKTDYNNPPRPVFHPYNTSECAPEPKPKPKPASGVRAFFNRIISRFRK